MKKEAQEETKLALEIDLNDPDTVRTLQYMTFLELVTAERATEILTP